VKALKILSATITQSILMRILKTHLRKENGYGLTLRLKVCHQVQEEDTQLLLSEPQLSFSVVITTLDNLRVILTSTILMF
jgi:hypothetical protein